MPHSKTGAMKGHVDQLCSAVVDHNAARLEAADGIDVHTTDLLVHSVSIDNPDSRFSPCITEHEAKGQLQPHLSARNLLKILSMRILDISHVKLSMLAMFRKPLLTLHSTIGKVKNSTRYDCLF